MDKCKKEQRDRHVTMYQMYKRENSVDKEGDKTKKLAKTKYIKWQIVTFNNPYKFLCNHP